MDFTFADVENQYNKDSNLVKEQVLDLVEWTHNHKQLPEINELQAILFLHSCFYNTENAKITINNFFTMKRQHSNIFKNRNPLLSPVKSLSEISLLSTLPKSTPNGDTLFIIRFMDTSPEKFNFVAVSKLFDMVSMLHFHSNGISDGFTIIVDYYGVTLAHLTKMGPLTMKKLITYLQEAMPVRLKGLHFVNTVSFMDKILALMKPFMKKELYAMIHLHQTVEDLARVIPIECLPMEYGGSQESFHILHENIKKKLVENIPFFEWEDGLIGNEEKPQKINIEEID